MRGHVGYNEFSAHIRQINIGVDGSVSLRRDFTDNYSGICCIKVKNKDLKET